MKKRLVWLVIFMMLLLTACTNKKKEPNTEKPEPEIEEEEKPAVDERCLEILEKAEYIRLGDVVEDSYQESIDFELDQEDIEALKEMKDELVMKNKPSASFYYYKLTIYDKERKVLDTWIVDVYYRIEAGLGYGIDGKGKLEELLETVEKKNDITYLKLYERVPGENYLQMLERAGKAKLIEITENNFIEGVFYDLEREDAEALREIKNTITLGDEKKELDTYHYKLTIYTEAGAALYFWAVDFDGKIYSDGYELKGEALRDWLDTIEEKSGITEKRKKSNNK